jgi:Type I restriction enzyme R protein N terminus (HSDR_N)
MIQPDFLQNQSALRLRSDGKSKWVFDPIRKKEVVLTPEELLRQLVLQYLLMDKKYPPNRIRVEIGITVNGLQKRCDIVVFDADICPWLLIECKSPKVAVTQATFEQAARYNMLLRAPYLAVTNGLSTFCCLLDLEAKTFAYLPDFPPFTEEIPD